MSKQPNVTIAPADGKLGILIPGMGAVTSTFMADFEAVKLGLGEPVGSLTQLGTVRPGKRTENRGPRIKEFVPRAPLQRHAVRFNYYRPRGDSKEGWDNIDIYFKGPMTAPGLYPEQDIFIQLMKLKNTLRWMQGEDLITNLGLEYYD